MARFRRNFLKIHKKLYLAHILHNINNSAKGAKFMKSISNISTKSVFNNRFLALVLSTTALLVSPLSFAHGAESDIKTDLPSGERVIGGKASFDRETPNTLIIKQETDRLFIDWHKGFNIGEQSATIFHQPDSNSIVVNRVRGKSANPTQILGELRANGHVIILDRNGIIFGKSSTIDVGSIIASTGDINAKKFLSGSAKISILNAVKGKIVNNGTITVSDSGLAAFVAPNLRNDGLIIARKGTVVMGQAQIATLDLYGDGLIEVKTNKTIKNSDIIHEGKIDIEGGKVLVTTTYVDKLVKNLVNMTDIAKGENFRIQNGKIIITASKPIPVPLPVPVPPVNLPSPTPSIVVIPAPKDVIISEMPASKSSITPQFRNWVTSSEIKNKFDFQKVREDGLNLEIKSE